MSLWLGIAFALTAFMYAMAGFGGGSTYAALLVVSGIDYRLIPVIVLGCNILVTSVAVWRFSNEGYLPVLRLMPLLAISAPAAWVGGMLPVPEVTFLTVMAITLGVSGIALVMPVGNDDVSKPGSYRGGPVLMSFSAGMSGFVAGMVGIGGGIFLAPVLHLVKWGTPKEISGACALFIVINSVSGLAGQLLKTPHDVIRLALEQGVFLGGVVAVGGLAGSLAGTKALPEAWIRKLTGGLVLLVSGRLMMTLARGL